MAKRNRDPKRLIGRIAQPENRNDGCDDLPTGLENIEPPKQIWVQRNGFDLEAWPPKNDPGRSACGTRWADIDEGS